MRNILLSTALLVTFFSSGQNSETKTYGSNTYEVKYQKTSDGSSTFQTIELKEGVTLYSQIVKAISSGKIKTYSIDAGFSQITDITQIELGFVTYEGYNSCKVVTREYIQVQVIGNKTFNTLIHQDQFTKMMLSYKEGKHLSMVKEFLYNTNFSVIPVVKILAEE